MASSARLVTIKRSGDDGAHFPLSLSSCLFGRSIECDIRIQLPVVSKKHCKIEVNEQQAILYNFSSTNPTQVNGATIDEPVQLKHGDIITIIDRSFRYENGSHEDGSRPTGFPGKSFGQELARRSWRASFPADSDGKGQDAKASKNTASRRSLVHAKRLPEDNSASDYSKDSVIQDPLNTCSSGHIEQHSSRNIGEPASGDLIKKSRATESSYRELKSPALSLCNSKKNESPFKKLYQSMKEELDIKSQKQSRRKSEPQPECVVGKDTWETKLLVACKLRPKSSRSSPGTAASSPRVGKMGTEKKSDVGPVETSTEALSSSVSFSETAKVKTPVRKSQPLKNEDVLAIGKRESLNLNENEGAKAVHKIVTPKKLGTRKQAAVTVEDAASPGDTPKSLSSKRRRSTTEVDMLPAETQNRFPSTQPFTPGEKDSVSKSEKLATAAEQNCSGLPGLSSVDISNFDEGMSLKRRRVSFGGHLRPELFDENLPPNTPLKRGETPTKRKSLTTHTPAVLKKIIKECRQSPRKQESPGITPPRTNNQRHRSGRNSPDPSGSSLLHQTDVPSKGRKSGNLPAKRASISRSQHDILQMICSKRRSGASEANLIVAKSWADVVKLGTKQIQTKVVKHVPQKQTNKRQRRPNTPKKPTGDLHNQFSTGHANSPCTIVIGRAQIEKVSMPARPYKMLNNLMLNRKMDFSEDLSGLTEMFKTPGKEKQQQMDDMDFILSNSENLPEKQFQITKSGDKPLPITSEILGEDVLSSTQNAAKEPSAIYSASPTLRRKSIKNGNTVQTPKNIYNFSHCEKKTPGSVTEPQKTVSSVSKLKKSRELIHTLVECMNENTEADCAEKITGRHLRKTLEGQEVDLEKASGMGSNAKEQKPTKDLIGIQMVTQTVACAEELLNQNQVKGTTENSEKSMHKQNTPIGDGHRATKQKVDQVCASKVKHWPLTPEQKAQSLEGPVGLKEPFETPNCRDNLTSADKSKVPYKSPQPTTENMRTNTDPWPGLSGKKVDVKKEDSAGKKFVRMSGETRPTPKVSKLEHRAIKALKGSKNQMLDLTVTGSKRTGRKAKEKTRSLDDLAGFQELFLSPVPDDKMTKILNKSLCSDPVRSPASTESVSKTGFDKVDEKEVHSTLGKRTKSLDRGTRTPTASALEKHDTGAFMETPKQKLDFTENSTGRMRRSRTPKSRTQPLEDLNGFQELFQTPVGSSDSVIAGETTDVSLECPQPDLVRTASTKRLSKTGLDKVDEKEVHSTLGKRTKSLDRGTRTPTASVLEKHDTGAFMETPKQKLDFTENSTGRMRRSRTPKTKAQPLEDLNGFQELFQTPVGSSDSVIVGETTDVSLECPQPDPVRGTASTKRLSKIGLDKVDEKEVHSTLGKRTKSLDRGTRTPTASVLEKHDTGAFMEIPKQKLDFTENSTGRMRRSRTPKTKAQPLEDLNGFQELFQTPVGSSDSVIVGETIDVSLECPQPDPVRGTASTKRLSKTGLDKVDEKKVHSTLGKRTKSLDRGTRTPTASVLEKHDTGAFMETPKQKLNFTENSTGRMRRSRTPKSRAQPLEDLNGFQELFQTPVGSSDSVIVGETTDVSLECPQPDPVRGTASTKRLSKTGLDKVDEKEVHSTLGKRTKSLDRGTRTPTASVLEKHDTGAFMETPKQKLDFTENSTGRMRRSRTPKTKAQPLEDLNGFQELFQTPVGSSDSVIVGETTDVSLECPQPDPVRGTASTKRLSKTGLDKVDEKEVHSTLGKRTKSLDRGTRTPTASVLEKHDTGAFMETPKQKLDFTENSTGRMRRSRTPKTKAQPLEDLNGFQELFQTPVGSSDSVIVGETTDVSLECPQPDPVRGTASTKRLSKIGLDKVDEKEVHSTLGKRTKSLDRGTRTPTASVLEKHDTGAFMEIPKQKLDFTENSTGRMRRSRTPKSRAQPLEDLNGFQELFQTPVGSSDSVIVGETTDVSLECPQPDPVRGTASTKRLSKTGLDKVDEKEVHSTLGKRTKSLDRGTRTPTASVLEKHDTGAFMEIPKQKLDFTENSTGRMRRSRTPKSRAQPLEDLNGFQELFQTPVGSSDSVIVGETIDVSLECPQPDPVRRTASTKRLSKTGLDKVDEKEVHSTPGKRTKSLDRGTRTPTASVLEKHDTTAVMETPKQKLESVGNLTGPKKQPRVPKEESQTLEDLTDCKELLKTTDHGSDPLTGKTKKMSLNSLQPEPVITLKSIKRQSRASMGKTEIREELSETEKHPQIEKANVILQVSNDNNGIRASKQATKRKLDPAASMPNSKRPRRTSRANTPGLEDLFQQLFQTPGHAKDSLTIGETLKIPTRSPQSGPVRSQTSRKSLPKVTLRRIDVSEELSTFCKQLPGKTSTVPGQQDNGIQAITKTLEKKLETAANATGLIQQQRASKEDLNGSQECFQTPGCSTDPLIGNKRKSTSSKSPRARLVRTSLTSKRLAKTSLGKVGVKEEISSLNMLGCATGEIVHIPRLLDDDVRGNKDLKGSITQTLGQSVSVSSSKKQRRARKERSQSPEGLFGLQELFETPASHKDSISAHQTTKISLESSEPEHFISPASTERLSKTGLDKVDEKEVHSTLGKQTKSLDRGTCTPTASVLEKHDTTAVMETPKQKLDFTENSTGHKRRSQTPKIKAQPLEDLDGFQELFQTPVGASVPVTIEEITKVSLECPQPEPVRTPASTKRLSKTSLDKVDRREKLSPLNKLRCSSQEVGHAARLSDGGRGTKDLKEVAAQISYPAVRGTGKKRQRVACKKSSQSSEDLFQTPGLDEDSKAVDKLTKMPHRSPPPEPVDASGTSQRQSRARRMKIHVKNELSGDRMLPKLSEEIMDLSSIPEGEDKGIRTRKRSVKRKLDIAVSEPSSKRQRVAIAEKAQTLMDLPAFKELYQTASLAVDSVTIDKTTKMPSKSPEPMDTISQTQPRRRLRRMGVAEEPIAQRKTTRVLREARSTHKEPMGDSKGVKDLKESSVQKQDLAVSLTGKRNQPRTLKKTQPLKELPSIQEETATRISYESQQLEEKESSTASKRQLRIQLCKVGVKEEPIAQRKPPGRKTRNPLKEPLSDSGNGEELKESTRQKIDPAAGVPVSKQPRRVLREKAQALELAGLEEPAQIPGHTEKSASNKRSTQMPCNSLQPQQVDSLQTSPRRLRTRCGKVEVDKEPSVVRKTVPTSRSTRSRKIDEVDDKDTQTSKEPAKQKLETAANETGSRRQLRAPKDEVQPLEVLGDSEKLAQISEHTEQLGHDTSSLKSILQQMPNSTKPLRTCRRVLRASKEDTMEMSVNITDPVESQSKNNTLMPPKRKSARDRSISRTRALRSVTKQEETDEKPAPTKQRAASSKRHVSPEPLKRKYLRIMSSKNDPVEEQISNIMKREEKEAQVENSAPPDQKMCLPSRYQKNNGRQPRPGVGASAETAHIKKTDKIMNTSREAELQDTDDGTKKSTSRGKVSGKRTCLRSRRQSEVSQPHAAEKKTSETGAEILIKTQRKEISGGSGVRCLRSRKARATLDSEPQPRVTRGAKKDTKVPKKDEDIVYTTKLRTRSQQNSKNM